MNDRLEQMIALATEIGRLRHVATENPTKENWVLHAVAIWRQGCSIGGPGDCKECNMAFLAAIGKHLEDETLT